MLVPHLLADGHKVTVYDAMYFGNGCLPDDNGNLTVIKGDVRYVALLRQAFEHKDVVIYLASLSSNAMHEAHPLIGDDINLESFPPALATAGACGVKRFIYASSVAAYGSSTEDAEEHQTLAPSTLYGHAKDHCENWLLAYSNIPNFEIVITRSASVCGYSVRQRFDLTVNMMVLDAVMNGVIKVNGGAQKRSHIHMDDICRAYRMLVTADTEEVAGQIFNFVGENQTVLETARIVAEELGAEIKIGPPTDDRSYSVDGSKALRVLGFAPKKTVRQAVRELKMAFDDGYWKDVRTNPAYMNMVPGIV